jgi:hypothetical protein
MDTYNLFSVSVTKDTLIIQPELHRKILTFSENVDMIERESSLRDGNQIWEFPGKDEVVNIINKWLFLYFNTKIDGCWLNILQPGGFNIRHNHGSSTIHSGVLYLSKDNSKIVFSGTPEAGSKNFEIVPNLFEILCFPGFLYHTVYPNNSKDKRVSLAFNTVCFQ